jgi:hypothetical protein
MRLQKCIRERPVLFDFAGSSTESIKQVRLTCRRFCNTSSHLLLDYVPVCLTRESLAHLDEVSRHPLLSKGVRAIKFSVVPYYDAVLANDIHAFATYRASKLRESVDSWEMFRSDVRFAPPGLSDEAFSKASFLAQSWDEVAAQGINASDADHVLLASAHEEYGKRHRDHKDVCRLLIQGIASAMMRIPTATWLSTDDCPYLGMGQYSPYFQPKSLDSPDPLLGKLVMPMGSVGWSTMREIEEYGLEPPPFYLISGLLLSIQQLGVSLKGLDLGTPPPPDGVSIA